MEPVQNFNAVVVCGVLYLPIAACNNGPPPGGKPAGTSKSNPSKVVCNDSNNTVLCFWEPFCGGGDWFNTINYAAQICAVHLDGVLNQTSYPNAEFDGTCNSTEQDELPWPPCVCVYAGEADPAICDNDSTPGAEDTGQPPTTGIPTTGENDTGGESDTDGPLLEIWRCSESAHTNCQVRTNNDDSACWAVTATPQRAQCVRAATYADAEGACECLCQTENNILVDGCDNPAFCTVTQPLDCTVPYPDSPAPVAAVDEYFECDATVDAQPAINSCANSGGVKLFDASATLVLSDGTSATLSGIVGHLSYVTSGCVSNVCNFDVELLGIRLRNATGTYVQGVTTGTFGIDDLHLQMGGSLSGSWYQTRGTVVFPNDVFFGLATISTVSIDSFDTSPPQTMFSTDQVVGSLSTTGSLSLNFTFNFSYGTATLALTTR